MDLMHIDAFLSALQARDADNWRWGQRAEDGYWIARYTGCRPPCTFHIELGPMLVYLHTTLSIHIWPECRLALYRYALRLNEEMSGAKLGLNHEGQPTLMVEWPREGLTFAAFETAVQTLLAYHSTYFPDIQLVAQDIDLASQIVARELEEQALGKDIQVEILSAVQAKAQGKTRKEH